MAKIAGFSEKTYEHYFNAELARVTKISFSPGQIDEEWLGFDAAFDLDPHLLFGMFHFSRFTRHRPFLGIDKVELDKFAGHLSKHLPNFKFNLFIQYKLAEQLRTANASEWKHWKQPYFRYELTKHQQKALEELVSVGDGRCACIYAAFASVDAEDLFAAVEPTDNVIRNSNIVEAQKLKGHGRYSFLAAGNGGMAHSEPEAIEGLDLEKLFEKADKLDGLTLSQSVKKLSEDVYETVKEDSHFKAALKANFGEIGVAEIEVGKSFYDSALTLKAFGEAFSVSCKMLSL